MQEAKTKNQQIEQSKKFLSALSAGSAVSGYEHGLLEMIAEGLRPYADELKHDAFYNVYAKKKGLTGQGTILLSAHSDEIGLMITDIDALGFLHFAQIAGVDAKTLLGQEVVVHGRQATPGLIVPIPESLLSADDRKKAAKIENMRIDIGWTQDQARERVSIGDTVTLKRTVSELLNDCLTGKTFDDRAGVAALAVCLEELSKLRHHHDVVAVATVQEEVGVRGASISAYRLNPDLAIAVDVTHAVTSDYKAEPIEMGKGPAIALGPNIHPALYRKLCDVALEQRLPYQSDPNPGVTGTDARAFQITQSGIPTGLVSIPLRYMHTSVETLHMRDVVHTGKLLAYFIAALPEDLEGMLCY
ncbi:MAG: M20/M25/M40 family metallo-hydrolase [Peptococcaceae bacterium]|jgi:endoglucanase|nr:M20/M25/M40 family metallo-hydrolase [Peptococcaceae bacterium]